MVYVHPSNDLNTCKMEHEDADDCENEIFHDFFNYVTYILD